MEWGNNGRATLLHWLDLADDPVISINIGDSAHEPLD